MNPLKIIAAILLALATPTFARDSKLTAEQTGVVEDTRAYALQYVMRLPNFICTQTTRRDITAQIGNAASTTFNQSNDVIEEQLTYADGKESYTVLTVDGKKTLGAVHAQLNGAISWGEFGSMSSELFKPQSHAIFGWDHEVRVEGRRAWVFKYHVPKESGTAIIDQPTNTAVVVSYSGKVIIDPETKDILEISSILDVPGTFPIRNVTRKVSYSDQVIEGKKYCLPTHSEMHLEEGGKIFDNQIDFKDYHHFSSESTVHFGDDAK